MEQTKSNLSSRYWWLFYPLLFFLIGLLIYALLWNPNNKIDFLKQQLKDCNAKQVKEKQPHADEKYKGSVVNCDAKVQSGGQGVTRTKHIMGEQSGRVILLYDTNTIPDEIKVFYDGKLITDTKGLVSGAGQLEWSYNAEAGKPNYCYVEVSAPTPQTIWEYIVNCPL